MWVYYKCGTYNSLSWDLARAYFSLGVVPYLPTFWKLVIHKFQMYKRIGGNYERHPTHFSSVWSACPAQQGLCRAENWLTRANCQAYAMAAGLWAMAQPQTRLRVWIGLGQRQSLMLLVGEWLRRGCQRKTDHSSGASIRNFLARAKALSFSVCWWLLSQRGHVLHNATWQAVLAYIGLQAGFVAYFLYQVHGGHSCSCNFIWAGMSVEQPCAMLFRSRNYLLSGITT